MFLKKPLKKAQKPLIFLFFKVVEPFFKGLCFSKLLKCMFLTLMVLELLHLILFHENVFL